MAVRDLLTGKRTARLASIERNLETYLATVIIVAYVGLILVEILGRLLLSGFTLTWIQEVTIGMFVWAGWLATAGMIRTDNHIRFEMVVRQLSDRGVYLVYWIEWILWIAFAVVILRYSIPYIGRFVDSGSEIVGTNLPKYYLYLSVPVGFALILFRTLQQMVFVTRRYRAGEGLSTDADLTEGR